MSKRTFDDVIHANPQQNQPWLWPIHRIYQQQNLWKPDLTSVAHKTPELQQNKQSLNLHDKQHMHLCIIIDMGSTFIELDNQS